MKTLILYSSKTGATKQYAEWLTQDLPESINYQIIDFDFNESNNYSRIILALPTRSGIIDSMNLIDRNWNNIKDKEVYLIVVGMVPQEAAWSVQSYNKIRSDIRTSLKGYVKLKGISSNADKKVSRIERFMSKLFIGIDPDTIEKRSKVLKTDLEPALKMLQI